VQTIFVADMRVSQHLSERLDTSGGTIKSKIPFCKAPCECAICQTYYRSMGEQKVDFCHYDGILTDEEAKSVLISYSNDMNSARDYLSRSIRKYGDLLLDRWKKRTPSKRAALLKLTEPDLPLKKGFAADMEYTLHLRRKDEAHTVESTIFCRILMWRHPPRILQQYLVCCTHGQRTHQQNGRLLITTKSGTLGEVA
jgi:hypothetical protein